MFDSKQLIEDRLIPKNAFAFRVLKEFTIYEEVLEGLPRKW